jgi:hypothetical protein
VRRLSSFELYYLEFRKRSYGMYDVPEPPFRCFFGVVLFVLELAPDDGRFFVSVAFGDAGPGRKIECGWLSFEVIGCYSRLANRTTSISSSFSIGSFTCFLGFLLGAFNGSLPRTELNGTRSGMTGSGGGSCLSGSLGTSRNSFANFTNCA